MRQTARLAFNAIANDWQWQRWSYRTTRKNSLASRVDGLLLAAYGVQLPCCLIVKNVLVLQLLQPGFTGEEHYWQAARWPWGSWCLDFKLVWHAALQPLNS
jgi:hypothetical protein